MVRAILGGPLIDGTGRDPIAQGIVVIDDGRIAACGSQSKIAVPKGAEVLDAAGRTILPGFVDCHVHTTYRARDYKEHLNTPPTYNLFKSQDILRATLECGITTARDVGGADAGFKKAIEDGIIVGPRLQVVISMISQTGGHADCWVPAGFRVPKRFWLPEHVVDGVDAMRRVAREFLMAGADYLKICTTGGITSVTDDFDETQLSIDEIRVAVAEAAARGKGVAVHAEGLGGIKLALHAGGIYSLEHGWFFDEECLDLMLEQGTWWVPTLALVPEGVKHRATDAKWDKAGLADEASKEAEIVARLKGQMPLYKHAREKGLKIAMGTDQSHRLLTGENLVELGYMVEYLGMTEMEAIVAATRTAAECLRLADVGTLEAGKRADVVVYDGDPLSDIAAMREAERFHLVMKDGTAFKDTLADGKAGRRPAAASA